MVTTLPAPITEWAPMLHALEDLRAVADEHVLAELDAPHPRLSAAAALGVEVVEVAVEDLDARSDQRARADADAGPLALDEGVVVDLHAVAELDRRPAACEASTWQ